jgi:glycolate oxidase
VYNRLNSDIYEELKSVVGGENIYNDPETIDIYSRDETEDYEFKPDVIIKPASAGEISQILRIASRNKIPVTPRGGGTGLSGGSLPVYGGICLSLSRLNRILEIDTENLQAVVEPGVITQVFQEKVEELGLFYPPDPASRGSCHLGGNLAECSGGPRAVKYGVTKDYVLGLEAVLPTGEIINTGGRVLKNVTGYNLTQLIIGSEGTLGVITKIILKLIPLPRYKRLILVSFSDLEKAADSVSAIFRAGVTPSALEIMERSAVKAAEERQNKKFPNSDAEAHLFIEIDGNTHEQLEKEMDIIAAELDKFQPLDMILADDEQKIRDVWQLRRGIGEAVKSISPYKEEDTVVPRAKIGKLIKGVKEISARYGITSICYGHAGDGNIHVNILKDKLDDISWEKHLDDAIREIFNLTVLLGGTISGEHGIGFSQKNYLPIAVGKTEIALMKKIKEVFDPENILNPGKIFPD